MAHLFTPSLGWITPLNDSLLRLLQFFLPVLKSLHLSRFILLLHFFSYLMLAFVEFLCWWFLQTQFELNVFCNYFFFLLSFILQLNYLVKIFCYFLGLVFQKFVPEGDRTKLTRSSQFRVVHEFHHLSRLVPLHLFVVARSFTSVSLHTLLNPQQLLLASLLVVAKVKAGHVFVAVLLLKVLQLSRDKLFMIDTVLLADLKAFFIYLLLFVIEKNSVDLLSWLLILLEGGDGAGSDLVDFLASEARSVVATVIDSEVFRHF